MSSVFSCLKVGALLFGAMLSISPVIATAGTCTDVINNLSDHAVGPNSVKFMMVMNTTDMTWAQYTTGQLVSTRRVGEAVLSGGGLAGRGKQYFSDRTWAPKPEPDQFGTVPHPFDPNKTDDVQIDIHPVSKTTADLNKPNNDRVTFTALSWGNAKSSSVPECKDGLMYGFVEGGGMYVISFKKLSNSIPR
jgi:hypothetical protein